MMSLSLKKGTDYEFVTMKMMICRFGQNLSQKDLELQIFSNLMSMKNFFHLETKIKLNKEQFYTMMIQMFLKIDV